MRMSCSPSIPDGVLTFYDREYPFGWLGILASVAPSSDELIYCRHERGFALHSLRSPAISRLYLQVGPGEKVEDWPDERVWAELATRFDAVGGLFVWWVVGFVPAFGYAAFAMPERSGR